MSAEFDRQVLNATHEPQSPPEMTDRKAFPGQYWNAFRSKDPN